MRPEAVVEESGLVDVAVPLGVDRTYTYRVPQPMRRDLRTGCRVLVSFGRKHLIGMAVELRRDDGVGSYKEALKVLDRSPVLGPALIELGKWMASYYQAPPGEAFRVMLPPGLLAKNASPDDEPERFWPAKRRLAVVAADGRVEGPLTSRQREVLSLLREEKLPVLLGDLVREGAATPAVLRNLEMRGAIRLGHLDLYRSPWPQRRIAEAIRHPLNPEQRGVLAAVEEMLTAGAFISSLIHGVTASGKTEIYLNAIERALELGRTALLLVPEIGLTPQVARQFRSWFGEDVAILHSGLSGGERFDQWRRIRGGEARVVVGTRSAVFAPLSRLGLIIVDEEHDASYKQNETPRYHARDTALKRGQLERAAVLLGSATPQLETYHNAVGRGVHRYLALGSRILDRTLPTVHIVDMRAEFEKLGKAAVVSDFLNRLIEDRLSRSQQVLILLNRRGYARLLLCRSCGHTETCASCSITLTFHQSLNRLTCHYCGYGRSVPSRCRECGKPYIYYVGEGTEKIQEIIEGCFPDAVVDRMDRDTVRRKGSVERILAAFGEGRTDILIGTQMIAKGHDFPGVTLVGVLGAEAGLRLADFRAAERTFQLLTQVAGRAGRGDEPGEVVIQSYYPNHYALRYACTQDYETFSRFELDFRRKFRYPPFCAMANVMVRDRDPGRARKAAAELAFRLQARRDEVSSPSRMRILGPAPAALEKLKDDYRVQVILKTTSRPELNQVLRLGLADVAEGTVKPARVLIDVDPLNLL
jgi:primosomal protein N' (replication factor Y) (superfamily II helicase)